MEAKIYLKMVVSSLNLTFESLISVCNVDFNLTKK
jgi:hypothetical protein